MGLMGELTEMNGGCRIVDIGWGLAKLVDIKGEVGMSRGDWQILRG